MAVPQNAPLICEMLGELVKWYEFAGKAWRNRLLLRNGHNRSLRCQVQVLAAGNACGQWMDRWRVFHTHCPGTASRTASASNARLTGPVGRQPERIRAALANISARA